MLIKAQHGGGGDVPIFPSCDPVTEVPVGITWGLRQVPPSRPVPVLGSGQPGCRADTHWERSCWVPVPVAIRDQPPEHTLCPAALPWFSLAGSSCRRELGVGAELVHPMGQSQFPQPHQCCPRPALGGVLLRPAKRRYLGWLVGALGRCWGSWLWEEGCFLSEAMFPENSFPPWEAVENGLNEFVWLQQ